MNPNLRFGNLLGSLPETTARNAAITGKPRSHSRPGRGWPVWMQSGMFSESASSYTGKKCLSFTGLSRSNPRLKMALAPFSFAHRNSATALSGSSSGSTAAQRRRPLLIAHRSASQRL